MSAAFPIVVHHNPECGTSHNVVEIIRAAGHEPVIIEYLQTGWTRPQLLALLAAAGLTPRAALRETKSPGGIGPAERGRRRAYPRRMLAHPVLVNRPIVATPKSVRLCRPSETVLDLLDRMPPGPLFKEDGALIIDAKGKRVA